MIPVLYQLMKRAGAIDSLKENISASNLNFVPVEEEFSQRGRLDQIDREINQAMDAERYEEVRMLQQEMRLLLLPSQQGQNHLESLMASELKSQIASAVPKKGGILGNVKSFASKAAKQWRSISGAELTFVPTTPEKMRQLRRRPDSPDRGDGQVAERPRISQPDFGMAEEDDDEIDADFKGTVAELEKCLGTKPPRIKRAVACAMRLIELVGEGDGEDLDENDLEMADASAQKVTDFAVSEINKHLSDKKRLNRRLAEDVENWRKEFNQLLRFFKATVDLGNADVGWEALEPAVGELGKAVCSVLKENIDHHRVSRPDGTADADPEILAEGIRLILLDWAASIVKQVAVVLEGSEPGLLRAVAQDVGATASRQTIALVNDFAKSSRLFSIIKDLEGLEDEVQQQVKQIALSRIGGVLKTLEDFDVELIQITEAELDVSFISEELAKLASRLMDMYDQVGNLQSLQPPEGAEQTAEALSSPAGGLPAAGEVPSAEEAPGDGGATSAGEVPGAGEMPSSEEATGDRGTTSTGTAPSAEEAPAVEEAPGAVEVPSAEEEPGAEVQVPSAEEEPGAEDTPSAGVAPSAADGEDKEQEP